MLKEIKTSTGLIIVFAAAVILFGGAYTWATYNEPNDYDYFAVGTSAISRKTVDETKDWKTYENKEVGFSFKYPKEWKEVKLNLVDTTNSNGYGGKVLTSSNGKNGVSFDPDEVFDFFALSKNYTQGPPVPASPYQKVKVSPAWSPDDFKSATGVGDWDKILFTRNLGKALLVAEYSNIECSGGLALTVAVPLNDDFSNLQIRITVKEIEKNPLLQEFVKKQEATNGDICDNEAVYRQIAKKIEDGNYSKNLDRQIKMAKLIANSIKIIPVTSVAKVITPPQTNPTAIATSEWKAYRNTDYGFGLTFADGWDGYKMKAVDLPGTIKTFYVNVPSTDKNYASETEMSYAGYAAPFAISVIKKSEWQDDEMFARDFGSKVGEKGDYVFTSSSWQACPTDLCSGAITSSLKAVMDSFKVL